MPFRTLDRPTFAHPQSLSRAGHYTDGPTGRTQNRGGRTPSCRFWHCTECGFGRRPTHQDVRRLIALHAEVVN
jgi:hypothetical protein